MLCVGVGLNNTGNSDEVSSCSELLLGAWARLEVRVGLQLTDLKLSFLLAVPSCNAGCLHYFSLYVHMSILPISVMI